MRIDKDKTLGLPKSTRKVYHAMLKASKPLKSNEIAAMTEFTDRTVRSALKILYKQKMVRKVPNFQDMRSHYHMVAA